MVRLAAHIFWYWKDQVLFDCVMICQIKGRLPFLSYIYVDHCSSQSAAIFMMWKHNVLNRQEDERKKFQPPQFYLYRSMVFLVQFKLALKESSKLDEPSPGYESMREVFENRFKLHCFNFRQYKQVVVTQGDKNFLSFEFRMLSYVLREFRSSRQRQEVSASHEVIRFSKSLQR